VKALQTRAGGALTMLDADQPYQAPRAYSKKLVRPYSLNTIQR